MTPPTRTIRHLLLWLVAGTRGGENRGRIIEVIRDTPMNTNQISIELDLDYRTVKHHLDILDDNGLVDTIGEGYGKLYCISENLEEKIGLFDKIWSNMKEKLEEDET